MTELYTYLNVSKLNQTLSQEDFEEKLPGLVETLFNYGYKFIGPLDGEMACGEYGKGKMSSPRQIISYLENII